MSYVQNLLISIDQLGNTIVGGSPDETLSAHSYRLHRDSKPWGVFMVLIDLMFSWQKPDAAYLDVDGSPIKAHCARAYMKEQAKFYLPDEYRNGAVVVQMRPDGKAEVRPL